MLKRNRGIDSSPVITRESVCNFCNNEIGFLEENQGKVDSQIF